MLRSINFVVNEYYPLVLEQYDVPLDVRYNSILNFHKFVVYSSDVDVCGREEENYIILNHICSNVLYTISLGGCFYSHNLFVFFLSF